MFLQVTQQFGSIQSKRGTQHIMIRRRQAVELDMHKIHTTWHPLQGRQADSTRTALWNITATCAPHARVNIQCLMQVVGLPEHAHAGDKGDLVGLHAAGAPHHLLEGCMGVLSQVRAAATGLDKGCVHHCVQFGLALLQALQSQAGKVAAVHLEI